MPDVFISFSIKDKQFADFLYKHLVAEGLEVFQASLSLKAGQKWGEEILQNLKDSKCVLFLASKAACKSANVLLEVGASVYSEKDLIPVVWDMPPENLPSLINQYQAINIAGASFDQIKQKFSEIAGEIRLDRSKGLLLVAVLIAGILYVSFKK